MRKNMHTKIAPSIFPLLLLFLVTAIFSCGKKEPLPYTHNVIPEPVSIQLNDSFFRLIIPCILLLQIKTLKLKRLPANLYSVLGPCQD